MENIFDLGKQSYVAASMPPQRSIGEHIRIGLETLFDCLKVLVLGVIYSFESLYHVFIPKTKKNVAGQVALITGGGNGIGKQIAIRLAHEGCKIAIVDIEREAAIRTAEEIVRMNGEAKGYHFDVADPKAVDKLHLEVQHDFGPVDILVNNAAILPKRSFMGGSFTELKRILDVNLNAVILMTHVFLETMMRRRKGHIINMISISSYHAIPGGIIYSTTKYALRGFTEALVQELRIDGFENCIHVTGVHPYFVATRKDLMDGMRLRIPALAPDTVANAAVDGMLRNELTVCIPSILLQLTLFASLLPTKTQNAIRDYILKEKEVKKVKDSWQK